MASSSERRCAALGPRFGFRFPTHPTVECLGGSVCLGRVEFDAQHHSFRVRRVLEGVRLELLMVSHVRMMVILSDRSPWATETMTKCGMLASLCWTAAERVIGDLGQLNVESFVRYRTLPAFLRRHSDRVVQSSEPKGLR